jgi:sterol desaturase/sphingolipid hydroxylase (fatty acid hydroxylase superfamily)
MTITTIIVNFCLAFILLQTADWTIAHNFGILQWLPAVPIWLYALIGLLLDLIGAYLVHLVEHKTKVLWRFHLIHHTDTWIDTTTANRHHPGVIRFTFTAIGVLLIGSPMWLVFLYQPYPLWLHNSTMLIFRFKKSRYCFKLFHCLARHAQSAPSLCFALYR